MNKQAGFTLIELVLVIVILGILAATALPRFSDLSSQARIATVNGMAGGLRSSAAIAHATQLARGLSSGAAGVLIDGGTVDFSGGYPSNATIAQMLVDTSGFTENPAGTFVSTGQTSCQVAYNNPGDGTFPTATVTSSGC